MVNTDKSPLIMAYALKEEETTNLEKRRTSVPIRQQALLCNQIDVARISAMKPTITWGLIIIVALTVTLAVFDYAEFIDLNTDALPQLPQTLYLTKEIYSSNIEIDINSEFMQNGTEEYSNGLMPSCVPFHEYIDQQVNRTKNAHNSVQTPIVLLAAFEYDTHLSVTIQNDGFVGIQVFCHYLTSDFKSLGPPSQGYGYPVYIVSCCRREGAAFISVTNQSYEKATHFVPITKRPKTSAPKYTFSVCLCPIYGTTPTWLLLTELIEHYKLQGVDHFYVYVRDMDGYSRKLLRSYIESGDVEAIYLSDHVVRTGEYWQQIGINDCVTRSRYHSKYVISQDLDERITPLKKVMLRDYIVQFFETHPLMGILTFRMRWILRDKIPPSVYEGKKTLIEHLPTLLYHNTSGVAPKGHTAKNILDPLKVLSMWVHYAEAMYPGYGGDYAPPEEFFIRHYRDVAISDWGTKWLPSTLPFGKYTNTFYPENLLPVLFQNVKRRLDKVYGY